jgi:hypothetical protein
MTFAVYDRSLRPNLWSPMEGRANLQELTNANAVKAITSANGFYYKLAVDPDCQSPTFPSPTLLLAGCFCGSCYRSRPIKKKAQHLQRPVVNAELLRFPRAGHVQDFDLL